MMAQLASEGLKAATGRIVPSVIAAAAVLAGALAALLTQVAAIVPRTPLKVGSPESISLVLNAPASLLFVLPLVLGTLLVTSEQSGRLRVQTHVANPRRLEVYGAKVATGLAAGAVLGLAMALAASGLHVGVLALNGIQPDVFSAPGTRRLAGMVAVCVLWAIIGVGIGALVRSQVAAVVGVVVFTQAIEPVLRVMLPDVGRWLPGGLSDQAAGGTLLSTAVGAETLPQLVALGLFVLYAVPFVAAGAVREVRASLV